MVTVDPDKSIPALSTAKQSAVSKPDPSGTFDEAFRRAVDASTAEPTGPESTQPAPEIRPPRFDARPLPAAGMIVDRVQHLIETMEAYGQRLDDREATMRDLEPLIDKMAEQRTALRSAAGCVREKDELAAIVNQSLTLASVEIARFKSGYYIDA